jgi:hypothetical protein
MQILPTHMNGSRFPLSKDTLSKSIKLPITEDATGMGYSANTFHWRGGILRVCGEQRWAQMNHSFVIQPQGFRAGDGK